MFKLNRKNKKSFLYNFLLNSVLITFILLTIINAVVFSMLYTNYKNNEETYVQKNLDTYYNNYQMVVNGAVSKCELITQNLIIIDLLNSDISGLSSKYSASLQLFSFINSLYDDSIQAITIYSANSSLFKDEYIKNINEIQNTTAYKALCENSVLYIDDNFYKNINEDLCFTVYRRMNILHDTVLRIDVHMPDIAGENIVLTDTLKGYNTGEYINKPLNDVWYAVSTLDMQKLGAQRVFFIFLFFILEMGLLLMSLVITKKINNKTVNEVNRLVEYASLNYSESLNTSFLSETSEYSEVEQIKGSIRNLINKIQEINREKADMELEKKDISLKLLQSKMNPHFLYNILSVISYKEIKKRDTETVNIINELVAYYRMILAKGKDFITLKEELELIKKYVFLVEISHSKKYELDIDMASDISSIVVPHMMLQPFVENSVLHGLSGSRENCLIKIKGYSQGDYVVFTIYDNGYGMNTQTLSELNSMTSTSGSYGIKNTYERMKLIYGYDFSISYKSEQNVYTEVTIKFSKLPNKDI